ncbi:MAG: mechanosensitive ion channel [Hydrogenovibrio sp.]|nr:mechanosensitive ion channel [Hydrogenovibrio sp.]
MNDLPLFQILLTVASVLGLGIFNWASRKALLTLGLRKNVPEIRVTHIRKYFKIIAFLTTVILILTIWGVDYRGLLVFASSILAVLGVALVAQWSILSNITAGVIIFFAFPVRIGDVVEIIDGANAITGKIIEINIFQVILRSKDDTVVSYPNSLILQRPIRKISDASPNEKSRQNTIRSRLKKDT